MRHDPLAVITALGDDYVSLWCDLSAFPTRKEVSEKIRIYKPRSLANLDCRGQGPSGRMTVGGRICYPRAQVVIWFASQAKRRHPHPNLAKAYPLPNRILVKANPHLSRNP